MQHLQITHIKMRRGKMDLRIAIALDALHVSPETAERASTLLPNITYHICVNSTNSSNFGEELTGTELAHLLEHVIIELQGKAHGGGDFIGHTSWIEELTVTAPQGYALMRTTVTFAHDLVALQAAKSACDIVEWTVDPQDRNAPDVSATVHQLRDFLRA